ncbi:MAG: hypothetical protein JW940_20330 [Polyangiaceae bacterium]|nr:hypothetical protein [Polyangiaceae bacterium]
MSQPEAADSTAASAPLTASESTRLGNVDVLPTASHTSASPDRYLAPSALCATETSPPAAVDLPPLKQHGRHPRRTRLLAATAVVLVLGAGVVALGYQGGQRHQARPEQRALHSAKVQVPAGRQNARRPASSPVVADPLVRPVAAVHPEPKPVDPGEPSGEVATLEDSFKAALKKQAAEQNAALEQSSAEADSKDGLTTAVSLVVDPTDATVWRNGAIERSAPLTYAIKKGQVVVLLVAHPGYRSRVVRLDGSRTEVSVTLQKLDPQGPL